MTEVDNASDGGPGCQTGLVGIAEDRAAPGRLPHDSTALDRASDRRIAVAFAAVLVIEVVLAFLADAGAIALWVWLMLSVGAVLIAGAAFGIVHARAESADSPPRRA